MKLCSFTLTAAALVTALACLNLFATEYVWTNTASSPQEWNTPGFWVPAGTPQLGDAVVLTDFYDSVTSSRRINQSGYSVTTTAIRVLAPTNIYEITVDNWWGGNAMLLKAPSGNAEITIKAFGNTDPGGYWGNLRITTGNGKMVFESDTDVTVTGNTTTVYLVTPLPLAGNATLNKHGNGRWVIENGASSYSGTINLYNGQISLGNNAGILTNATAIVVHPGGKLSMGTQHIALQQYDAPVVLNGGLMQNDAGERHIRNVTLTASSSVDPAWWRLTFNGTIQGTGTLSVVANGTVSIFGANIKPGFSIGVLNFHRTGSDFYFTSNAAPTTLHIEVSGAGGVPGVDHDQVNVTGLQAERPVDLANLNVSFSGTGGAAATNWFFTANQIVNGSTLGSVSFASGMSGTVVYDYASGKVGAVVIPEPALALACAALLALLRPRA